MLWRLGRSTAPETLEDQIRGLLALRPKVALRKLVQRVEGLRWQGDVEGTHW